MERTTELVSFYLGQKRFTLGKNLGKSKGSAAEAIAFSFVNY
jgi:hypothetical protein